MTIVKQIKIERSVTNCRFSFIEMHFAAQASAVTITEMLEILQIES